MITKNLKVFENQTQPKTVEISNSYNCENMVIQVESEAAFVLRVLGRVNSEYPYQQISVVSDEFKVYSNIVQNGTYSIATGGKPHIAISLISIDSGGKLNCFANMF